MKKTRILPFLALLALLLGGAGLTGCQQQLFSDTDGYRKNNIDKYYNGDSAVETRATRSRAAEMGFGYPTGMANQ